jgi:hypothetical protein
MLRGGDEANNPSSSSKFHAASGLGQGLLASSKDSEGVEEEDVEEGSGRGRRGGDSSRGGVGLERQRRGEGTDRHSQEQAVRRRSHGWVETYVPRAQNVVTGTALPGVDGAPMLDAGVALRMINAVRYMQLAVTSIAENSGLSLRPPREIWGLDEPEKDRGDGDREPVGKDAKMDKPDKKVDKSDREGAKEDKDIDERREEDEEELSLKERLVVLERQLRAEMVERLKEKRSADEARRKVQLLQNQLTRQSVQRMTDAGRDVATGALEAWSAAAESSGGGSLNSSATVGAVPSCSVPLRRPDRDADPAAASPDEPEES